MNSTTHPKKSSRSGISLVLLGWLSYSLYLFLIESDLFIALPRSLLENVLQSIWNVFLAIFSTKAILKVWAMPLYYQIVPDTGKLGGKIQWYEKKLKELTPENKAIYWIRWTVLLALSIKIYLLGFLPFDLFRKWSLSFSELLPVSSSSISVTQYFSSGNWPIIKQVMIFSTIFYTLLLVEGRTRIFLRLIKHLDNLRASLEIYLSLDSFPFDPHANNLDMCLFSTYVDTSSQYVIEDNGEKFEKWYILTEKGLNANLLIISPTSGGKTSAIIKRAIYQTIVWQKDNIELKASAAIYDPKDELSQIAIDIAQQNGRGDDLLILELGGEHQINPIRTGNITAGNTAWMVSGWITAAWQNFQGQSSPEPFWESQNYILTRNLLNILYCKHHDDVTLYRLSKILSLSTSGCQNQEGHISDFGLDVLICSGACQPKKVFEENLDDLVFQLNIDQSKITDVIKERASQYRESMNLKISKDIEESLLSNNKSILSLVNKADKAPSPQLEDLAQKELSKKLKELVAKELESRGKDKVTVNDWFKALIIEESSSLRRKLDDSKYSNDEKLQFRSLVLDSVAYLKNNWSKMSTENRGNVVSNMAPFLQQFETPELKSIFSSSKDSFDFDKTINAGKILVPRFSGISVGEGFSRGIITLIKSRWQSAVLGPYRNQRRSVQLMDEAQRVLTLGSADKAKGDLDYMELSRSFGGITILASQSVAAMEAKASRVVDWEKIHGVCRSIICLSTNDIKSIDFLKKSAGEVTRTRISRTVGETASSPKMDLISEKYKGEGDAINVSYTTNEVQENRIKSEYIQDADAFSGIGIIYDGRKNHVLRTLLRPVFWPDPTDSYEFMQHVDFDLEKRSRFKSKLNISRLLFKRRKPEM